MDLNSKDKFMALSINHNLNWLINFHNYVRELLKERLKNLDAAKIQKHDSKYERNALFDNDRIVISSKYLQWFNETVSNFLDVLLKNGVQQNAATDEAEPRR